MKCSSLTVYKIAEKKEKKLYIQHYKHNAAPCSTVAAIFDTSNDASP